MSAPYSITLQVDGTEEKWTADTLDRIMKQWRALGPQAGLTLWFGEKRVTTLLEPYKRPEGK